ncbi:PVC-type heme-binding CxxCH protein [Roseimaritima sediminicola]|uniref:PVC-type heme-binding CxxCH protein n=1 Tax=Roseimaritima sediminicola TaxID=2662066 RepID=UPI001386F468|nr:PVC-type heme-binding CxxCH protein [Roseimaritima sediminicola]
MSRGEDLPRIAPKSPEEALATIVLEDGFRAELVAAEPMVTDPIAMQYDENGAAYVVEMNDYPYSDKSHDQAWQEQTSEPIGRVRLLQDTDGDGTFDKSTIFADRLSWPTGVAVWKGGVYVMATPDVFYLKDTDGDGRADIRRKVFTGFRKYNVQAVMNNPKWGLDHRIYAAGSSNGGKIESADSRFDQDTASPTVIRRSDFRFDPRDEKFEAISGGARFGHARDDWGNRFLTDIRNPVQHVLFPTRYLRRNPRLRAPRPIHDVVPSGDSIAVFPISPAEPWRAVNAARLAADSTKDSPFDSTVAKGYVTSSSGVTIYRGAAYPEAYYGNAFIGEVAGNLVMRYALRPDGVTFTGQRAHENREFMASTDNWFRPVNFINAPDGTLHVLDMYRETIEHPWSMPDDLKAQVDLTSGRDRGRIYRLVPEHYRDGFVPPPVPRLGSATTQRLVAELANPNSWWRETAHRLLFERQDTSENEALETMLGEHQMPVARVHALWTLEGLRSLTDQTLAAALRDADARVREQAIRIAEPRLPNSPTLRQLVIDSATDPDPRVRFQTAFTLGQIKDEPATAALAEVARRDADDPRMCTAILSSAAGTEATLLKSLLENDAFADSAPGRGLLGQLAAMVGAAGDLTVVDALLQASADHAGPVQETMVRNLAAGLRRAKQDLVSAAAKPSFQSAALVASTLDDAARIATDTAASLQRRQQAITLLGFAGEGEKQTLLVDLLSIQHPLEIQSAAVTALVGTARPDVAPRLLEKFPELTPSVQKVIVDQLLQRTVWIPDVLDAVAAGVVPARLIAPNRRAAYLKSRSQAIQQRAVELFGDDVSSSRSEVLARYQSVLEQSGDARAGVEVFRKNCQSCHRYDGSGFEVGPNLATVQNRGAGQLLVNILDPSREVSPEFLEYVVLSTDGRVVSGMIAAENTNSITLKQSEGVETTFERSEIEELRATGKSLMPEGLETEISPAQMADLIAYLLSLGKS